MATNKSLHQLRFDAAVKVIENLPGDGSYQPSQEILRVFYSYYKQATVGPCDVPKPSYWDTEGKAKWEAWKALGNMTKEAAMMEYVQEIKEILEILPVTEEVSELLDVLGNFYEFVDDDGVLSTSVEFIRAPHSEPDENLVSENMEISQDFGVEAGEDDDDDDVDDYGEDGDDGDDEEEEVKAEQSKNGNTSVDEIELVLELKEEQFVDLTRPIIDVTGWRGGSPVSMKNSSSSLSNDTHSSLDTQEEDEELACSQEPPQKKPLCCVNEHVYNDNGVASGQSLQTQAPDNEVNCDSSEHPAPEEGATVPRISLAMPEEGQARRESPLGENKALQCGNQEPNPQSSPPSFQALGTVQPDQSLIQMEGSDSHGTEPSCHRERECKDTQRSKAIALGATNRDVAIALTRLQADMQDVLQRLSTLEAQKAIQTKSLALRRQEQLMNETRKRISWWPFSLSPIPMSLAIVWPILVHWIVDFYYQRRRRQLR